MTDKVGLNETEYLDLVERIQRAMCIEPFCPDVTDMVVLIGTVRMLDREVKRLRAELAEWEVENGMNRTFIREEMGRLRAALKVHHDLGLWSLGHETCPECGQAC